MLPIAQAISIEPKFALAFVVAFAGAVGSFVAVKLAGAETQRLVKALHSRFDRVEDRVSKAETAHAVLEERVANIKTTQRLRAARAAEQDMFGPGED